MDYKVLDGSEGSYPDYLIISDFDLYECYNSRSLSNRLNNYPYKPFYLITRVYRNTLIQFGLPCNPKAYPFWDRFKFQYINSTIGEILSDERVSDKTRDFLIFNMNILTDGESLLKLKDL